MIINELSLNNIGLFRGLHTFNLIPGSSNEISKPIILIGGKNGTGKTTLFEAIRLCLYGKKFLKSASTNKEYKQYLSNKIHHITNSSSQPSEAYIKVEFEYSHLGQIDTFVVKRSWKRVNSKISEKLEINKNGERLDDVEIDQWQDFLNELIPLGISRLFFFDGEEIQHLADNEETSNHLKDSFKSLLQLDIAERLQADLAIYSTRHLKQLGIHGIDKQLAELENEQKTIDSEFDDVLQDRAQKQSYYDQIAGDIERHELKITKEGGAFASKRDDLKKSSIKLESDIEVVKNQIREISSNLLPFAITPKFCKVLKNNLIEEEQYQKLVSTQEILNNKVQDFKLKIASAELWDEIVVSKSSKQIISKRLSEIIDDVKSIPDDFKDYKPLHQLSALEHRNIMMWTDQVLDSVPAQLTKFSRKLERLTRKRQQIAKSLNSVPEDDVLSPLIQKLTELNQGQGQLQEQIRIKDIELNQIEYKLENCSRRIQVQLDKIQNHDKLSISLKLAGQVQTVLKEYIVDLQKEKIKDFKQAFLASFNKLSRKGNFIDDIDVDLNDFSITLYYKDGKSNSKSQLSAGEKQIYAISMLWALTQTSGRPLPFIIDTPLGRLDSDHRSSIVMDFFPNASHQMIIFSTDTEIDNKYFNDLSPYITRVYHLEYCDDKVMTETTQDYFWNQKEVEPIHELQ